MAAQDLKNQKSAALDKLLEYLLAGDVRALPLNFLNRDIEVPRGFFCWFWDIGNRDFPGNGLFFFFFVCPDLVEKFFRFSRDLPDGEAGFFQPRNTAPRSRIA